MKSSGLKYLDAHQCSMDYRRVMRPLSKAHFGLPRVMFLPSDQGTVLVGN